MDMKDIVTFGSMMRGIMSNTHTPSVLLKDGKYHIQWEHAEPPDGDWVLMSVELFKDSIRILNKERMTPMCVNSGHDSHALSYALDSEGIGYWYCFILGKPKHPFYNRKPNDD
jgi:hypothetical protein